MMKIAFVMIHYPVAMGRYMLEALLRRKDVEVWSAGPFTARWIPWGGGMHLPESYVRQPDFAMPFTTAIPPVVYEVAQSKCPFDPDLWLEVNAGLKAIGRPSGRYAVIGTDPHVLDYTASRMSADTFYCMQKPYMRPQDKYLPYGFDPVWHALSPIPFTEREIDAALLGLQYENRISLIKALRAMGRTVHFELGKAYEDARDIYHNTKVGLNWSSQKDTTARVYELMAMGTVPVLNRVPDLGEMFEEDRHYLGFDNLPEALDKVTWALDHPDEADMMAYIAASDVIENGHSWDDRIEQVLTEIGLLA